MTANTTINFMDYCWRQVGRHYLKKELGANPRICSAAIINVSDFIDDFVSLWYESLYG